MTHDLAAGVVMAMMVAKPRTGTRPDATVRYDYACDFLRGARSSWPDWSGHS
jgi:hypothetical protein